MEGNETVRASEVPGVAEWDSFPLCDRVDCHAWQDGRCMALSENDFGSRCCPFYKDRDVNREEQKKAMLHLVQTGRVKLIRKYKKVLEPLGLFDVADSFTENVTDELERYSEDVLQELLGGCRDTKDLSGTLDAEEEDWDD